jgi:hypothetical protein
MNTPKIIYLQQLNDIEITWCDDQINDDDVEYIKKSEYDHILSLISDLKQDAISLEEYARLMSEKRGYGRCKVALKNHAALMERIEREGL